MHHRQRRRLFLPLLGAALGALGGLAVGFLVDVVFVDAGYVGAYVGGAFVGIVGGFVLGFLLAATRDDGEDEATSYDGRPGRADTPVEGAEAEDLERRRRRRSARRPALRR
jgi:hypothetical protein